MARDGARAARGHEIERADDGYFVARDRRQIGILRHRARSLSPAAEQFVEALRASVTRPSKTRLK